MRIIQVTLFYVFIFIIQCNGTPRFANYIQDHMVLQRAPQRAIVWGYGDPSTLTILKMNDQIYSTVSQSEPTNAQNESIWSVTLDPVSDEGPFDIHVSQPLKNGTLVTITIHDVLFGDVWLCSGQSNMVLTVSRIYNGSEEIQNAGKYPKIRLFTSTDVPADAPHEELLNITQNWSVASPESVNGTDWRYFSAICWLYGRRIHEALGGRPIGLIVSAYVGTAIEVWMPPQALHDCNVTLNEDMTVESYNGGPTPIPTNHSSLYNSMIHPFTRMVIYGIIWYQGEAGSVLGYACLFARMITRWREIWNNRTNGSTDIQFPFGFVQLGTASNDTVGIGSFPYVRWHQTFDVGYVPNNVVPKVFMAVAVDLRDDPHGVHTATKEDVGYRLSRSGLAVAYGQKVEFLGPIAQNVSYINGSDTISISYTAVSDFDLRSRTGFEVCCGGTLCRLYGIWYASPIINKNGLTITISVNSTCVGKEVTGVRYLWRETPCLFKQAPLYSITDPNLPSPPYFKYLLD